MRHASVALAALALMSGTALAADPTGDWMVEDGTGIIRIGPCGSLDISPTDAPAASEPAPAEKPDPDSVETPDPDAPLCGVLAWAKPPNKGKSLIGTTILSEMKPTGENRWEGEVINPRNGKVYQSFMMLKSPNVLRIQGCVLGFLCGSQEWTRQ
jgi:uncharacterized protein (DUF2147 family)